MKSNDIIWRFSLLPQWRYDITRVGKNAICRLVRRRGFVGSSTAREANQRYLSNLSRRRFFFFWIFHPFHRVNPSNQRKQFVFCSENADKKKKTPNQPTPSFGWTHNPHAYVNFQTFTFFCQCIKNYVLCNKNDKNYYWIALPDK